MRFVSKARLGLVLCCALAACAKSQPPAAPKNTDQTFVTPDGKMNYPALHKAFGEPNKNLVLNPKAIDVGKTPARNAVSIEGDRLIFRGPNAGWLRRLGPDYTLYCNTECGGEGFIRNIVSVHREASHWVVMTNEGSVADVVETGWLHGHMIVTDLNTHHQPRLEWKKTINPPTQSKTGSVGMPAPVTGSIQGTASFTSQIDIDIVTSGFHIQTFSVIATGTPAIDVTLDATASASYSKDWQLFTASFPLGEIQLGPVPVFPTLQLTGKAHAEASGSVNLHGTAHAGVALTAGFIYDYNNGPAPKGGYDPSFNQSLTLSGKANAKAYVEVDAALQFQIAGVAGPDISVNCQLGAEGSASFSAGESNGDPQCVSDLQGDVYFNVGGTAGVNLTIPHFGGISKSVDLGSKTYNIQSYDYPNAITCGQGGSSGSTGSETGGSTGTDSGGSTGSDTGGSTGSDTGGSGSADTCQSCGSDDDCASGSCNRNVGLCDVGSGNSCAASSCVANGGTCSSDDSSCDCVGDGSNDGNADCQCTDGSGACPDGSTLSSCCQNGEQDCGDGNGCHDLSTDAQNCGTCALSCADELGSVGAACQDSQCVCLCPDGVTACPDGVSSDSCESTASCGQDTADCDMSGNCATDIANDPANCGGCGNQCASGSCAAQQCICPDGQTPCDDTSCANCQGEQTDCQNGLLDCDGSGNCDTDGTSDPNNCGGCSNLDDSFNCANVTGSEASTCDNGSCHCICPADGSDCPDGQSASSCTTTCDVGTMDCDGSGSCGTDITSDPSNCGGCGDSDSQFICNSGSCNNGQCACPDGSAVCPDGSCADPDILSDAQHCGDSCENCLDDTGSSNSQCENGVCVCYCSDGVTQCPDGTSASCDTATCPDGQMDCDGTGQCNDLSSDPNNCGACGNSCATGVCVDDQCACDDSGTPDCNGACPDYSSDTYNCGSFGNDCSQDDGSGNTGAEAYCNGGGCECDCTCDDGSSCPSCDSSQCPSQLRHRPANPTVQGATRKPLTLQSGVHR